MSASIKSWRAYFLRRFQLGTEIVEEGQQPLSSEGLRGGGVPPNAFEHALEHISCFVCREAFDGHHGDAENHPQAEFLLIAFDRRREPLERLHSTPGQRLGFVMRGAIPRVRGRVKEIFDRAWIIAALLEMHREFRGDFADAIPIDRFAAADRPGDGSASAASAAEVGKAPPGTERG